MPKALYGESMKVILLADVKGTGKKNDIVEVSDGFARNMLIKKNLAKEATSVEINALKLKQNADEFHRKEEIKRIKEEAKRINGQEIVCKVKAGDNDRIFGSVTSKEIADTLISQGYEVDKRKIQLKDAIKALGTYEIEIKYLPDTVAKIKLKVEKQ